jgi:predicted dehydrogenase
MSTVVATDTPRLGFIGAGWIGRARLDAVARTGRGTIEAVADVLPARRELVAAAYPSAAVVDSVDALLSRDLDGVVVATPNAQHEEHCSAALARGLPVFCQKPLAPRATRVRRVIEAARRADRLLDIDLSYRHTQALSRVRELVVSGRLGHVYALDLEFHNAYGPDKAWCRDPALAGGGCLLDLGVHLIDMAFWISGARAVQHVQGHLFTRGRPWQPDAVEDFAELSLTLDNGAVARIACSWELHAGQDAVIGARFWGTHGGAGAHNVNGSFFDFVAEHYNGRNREAIAAPPDDWGPGAILSWIDRIGHSGYDPSIERQLTVAAVIDTVYEQCAH